jgi:hypothetical protein
MVKRTITALALVFVAPSQSTVSAATATAQSESSYQIQEDAGARSGDVGLQGLYQCGKGIWALRGGTGSTLFEEPRIGGWNQRDLRFHGTRIINGERCAAYILDKPAGPWPQLHFFYVSTVENAGKYKVYWSAWGVVARPFCDAKKLARAAE